MARAQPSLARRAAAAALIALGVAWLALLVGECWPLAFAPDARTIADYRFGGEAMVGHGGWPYRSVELYVWWTLTLGLVGAASFWLAAGSAVLRSWWHFVAACALCFAYWFAGICIEQFGWWSV